MGTPVQKATTAQQLKQREQQQLQQGQNHQHNRQNQHLYQHPQYQQPPLLQQQHDPNGALSSPHTPSHRQGSQHSAPAASPFPFSMAPESPFSSWPQSPSVVLFSGPSNKQFERVHDESFPASLDMLKSMARKKFKFASAVPIEMSYINPDGVTCELDDEYDLKALAAHAAQSRKLKVNVKPSSGGSHTSGALTSLSNGESQISSSSSIPPESASKTSAAAQAVSATEASAEQSRDPANGEQVPAPAETGSIPAEPSSSKAKSAGPGRPTKASSKKKGTQIVVANIAREASPADSDVSIPLARDRLGSRNVNVIEVPEGEMPDTATAQAPPPSAQSLAPSVPSASAPKRAGTKRRRDEASPELASDPPVTSDTDSNLNVASQSGNPPATNASQADSTKKRSGRPKKVLALESPESTQESPLKAKKPAKSQRQPPKGAASDCGSKVVVIPQSSSTTAGVQEASATQQALATPEKRGRGRPRKVLDLAPTENGKNAGSAATAAATPTPTQRSSKARKLAHDDTAVKAASIPESAPDSQPRQPEAGALSSQQTNTDDVQMSESSGLGVTEKTIAGDSQERARLSMPSADVASKSNSKLTSDSLLGPSVLQEILDGLDKPTESSANEALQDSSKTVSKPSSAAKSRKSKGDKDKTSAEKQNGTNGTITASAPSQILPPPEATSKTTAAIPATSSHPKEPAANGKPSEKAAAPSEIVQAEKDESSRTTGKSGQSSQPDKCIVCKKSPWHPKDGCEVYQSGIEAVMGLMSKYRGKSSKNSEDRETQRTLLEWTNELIRSADSSSSQSGQVTTLAPAPDSTHEPAASSEPSSQAGKKTRATSKKTKTDGVEGVSAQEKNAELPPPSGIEPANKTKSKAVAASSATKTSKGRGKAQPPPDQSAESTSASLTTPSNALATALRAPSASSEDELATSPMLHALPRNEQDMDVEPMTPQPPVATTTAAAQLEERRRKMRQLEGGSSDGRGTSLRDSSPASVRSRSASVTSSDTSEDSASSEEETESDEEPDTEQTLRITSKLAANERHGESNQTGTKKGASAAIGSAPAPAPAPPAIASSSSAVSSEDESSSSSSSSDSFSDSESESNSDEEPAATVGKPEANGDKGPSSKNAHLRTTATNPFLKGIPSQTNGTSMGGNVTPKSAPFTRLSDLRPSTLRQSLSQPGSPMSAGGMSSLGSSQSQSPFFSSSQPASASKYGQKANNGATGSTREEQSESGTESESESESEASSSSSSEDESKAQNATNKRQIPASKRAGMSSSPKKRKSVFSVFS